jgi:hypothetical protein
MRNLNKTTYLFALLTLALSFTSCKKDKEDPTITVSTPAAQSVHLYENEVHIDATFEDDQGLKSYTVMVGDADGTMLTAFDFMETGTISGLTYNFHDHFSVPTDGPMMAWIYFTVVDAEDKSITKKWMLHFEE